MQQQALTYLGTGESRDKNNDKISNCLRKSVSNGVLVIVFMESECYTFMVTGDPEPLEDDPCCLKAIIKSYLHEHSHKCHQGQRKSGDIK